MAANVIALDAGTVRVGVAVARRDVRIARPVGIIAYRPASVVEDVERLVAEHQADTVVVGWPRGLEGQPTRQTAFAEELAEHLRQALPVRVVLQDEALTSRRAEAELVARRKPFGKQDIDALAAAYILEDFLHSEEQAHALPRDAA